MIPNIAASTKAKSSAEKKDDVKFCCACCISVIPGCAIAPNASRQQQNVMKNRIDLKANRAGVNDSLLFGQCKKIIDRNAA